MFTPTLTPTVTDAEVSRFLGRVFFHFGTKSEENIKSTKNIKIADALSDVGETITWESASYEDPDTGEGMEIQGFVGIPQTGVLMSEEGPAFLVFAGGFVVDIHDYYTRVAAAALAQI